MTKQDLEKYLPHWLLTLYYKNVKHSGWFGDYPNWQAANAAAQGYDDAAILQRVLEAARKVQRGEAAFERDAVTFDTPEYSEHLLRIFDKIAAENGGKLSVLDFGGSIGSSFFQYQTVLKKYNLTWCVVEQKHFVDAGKAEFETDTLHFEYSIAAACEKYQPNLIFVSSVLQYLENPYEWIEQFAATRVPYLLIDMQPVTDKQKDRITVQRVPASIYRASYSCHLLAKKNLLNALQQPYQLLESFDAWAQVFRDCFYKGYFLARKSGEILQ
jgi:putative methyltransferase (TIGR04325 family)